MRTVVKNAKYYWRNSISSCGQVCHGQPTVVTVISEPVTDSDENLAVFVKYTGSDGWEETRLAPLSALSEYYQGARAA